MNSNVVRRRPARPRPMAQAAAWAAELLLAVQQNSGLQTLRRALLSQFVFRNFIVFEFRQDRQPLLLDTSVERERLLRDLSAYLLGLYQLDPFYRLVAERGSGLFRLDDIAPRDFRESEYFNQHYRFTSVIDELRFVVPLDHDCSVHVFIEREDDMPVFSAREVRKLADIEPMVRAFVTRHMEWRHRRQQSEQSTAPAFDLHARIRTMLPEEITAREVEVVELMLKGHSAKSIAFELRIEEGTVTNHKRNIYSKMGIHSQAQLFDRFLRSLTGQ